MDADFNEQDYQEIASALAAVKSGKFYTSKDIDEMIFAKNK